MKIHKSHNEPAHVKLLILARRFFDKEHFQQIMNDLGVNDKDLKNADITGKYNIDFEKFPFDLYGKEAFIAWLNAYQQMEFKSLFELPTLADFLNLHKIAYSENVGGFIAYKNSVAARAATDYSPRGQLRNGPIYFADGPSATDINGKRIPLTAEQFERLKKNPNIQFEQNPKNGKVKMILPYSSQFASEIEFLFSEMHRSLNKIKELNLDPTDYKYKSMVTEVAAGFYWELSSRHIVWDGSGRTTKLIRDWIFMSMHLTPPKETTQLDWELTKSEYIKLVKSEYSHNRHSYMFNFNNYIRSHNTESIIKVKSEMQSKLKTLPVITMKVRCEQLFVGI